jgi:hypothetical protein
VSIHTAYYGSIFLLQALPATLPAQIGCLGRYLLAPIYPWASCGRAAANDSTLVRVQALPDSPRTDHPSKPNGGKWASR